MPCRPRQYGNLIDGAFGGISRAAIANSEVVASYLNGPAPFTTQFPATNIGKQLRTIARLIAVAPQLGLKRQVFFARMSGYGLHGNQIAADNSILGPHADLLGATSKALDAFYRSTVELGCAQQVPTFTASDFGRTFRMNGDGSDHGWAAIIS